MLVVLVPPTAGVVMVVTAAARMLCFLLYCSLATALGTSSSVAAAGVAHDVSVRGNSTGLCSV